MDRRLRLRDGRWLGYLDYGDLDSMPILCCHGLPGSRLDFSFGESTVIDQLGARLIVPDRPGYGLSDFQPGRRLLDWPDDVAQLADALGIAQFAVLGVSGGGAYAAACAYRLPQRITKLGLVGSVAPVTVRGLTRGMHRANRRAGLLARGIPWVVYRYLCDLLAAAVRASPGSLLVTIAERCGWGDLDLAFLKEILEDYELTPRYREQLTEPFRTGGRGCGWDMKLLARGWGFRIEEITTKTYLWHGERDTLAPPPMGRYLACRIPHCTAHFFHTAGHDLMQTHQREILTKLASRSRPSGADDLSLNILKATARARVQVAAL